VILLASLTLISALWIASHIVVMLILLQILQCTQSEVVFEGLSLWDLHLVNWKEFQESVLPLSSGSNKVCCLYFVRYLCHGTTFQLKVPYLNEVCSCHVLIFLCTESFFLIKKFSPWALCEMWTAIDV
jgi:hypothetical protein